MRKLKLQELERDTIAEYKSKDKLPITVVLDNIRSGMNVGSFFRTCDAFLVEKICLIGITPRPPHKEISKTAIGATSSVQWEHYETIDTCLRSLKENDYQIYSIEQTTESIALNQLSVDIKAKIALVFGNEVTGVSNEALELSDMAIELPQYGTKHSLNVSVCGGIVIHKFSSEY